MQLGIFSFQILLQALEPLESDVFVISEYAEEIENSLVFSSPHPSISSCSSPSINPSSSTFVKGFDSPHLLNLDDNCIDSWEEILKLSQLKSLEQLFLNHNNLSCIWYPDHGTLHETANGDKCLGKGSKPFKNLHSLLLGNTINIFTVEVRLSENPVTYPVKSDLSRFVLVARLAGVKIINGSEAFTVRYWKASNILLTWFDFETLMQGEKLHGLRIKLEYDIDVCVDNALLDMYAKCGCMDGAFMVFKSMNERTIVSWTAMIAGYAQNGCPKEALEIFHEMRSRGVEPNVITLICVLYACSQGGLIDEGWSIFSSMSREYGIVPIQDHYACMVNLLGRAGRIKEAEELILGMPYQPGLLVWQTLLGACVLHGDTETAKRAAEKALNINKNDPATYVLLSNTFASLHHWENVGNLREIMESRDVKKVPGSSWLEINRGKSLLEALGEYA
nr:pentatricopeptide repeat-containing protein At2g13600-like [Ipomoea batatas]